MGNKKNFFSQQLRKIMFEKNLTQKDLGDLLGVKRPMISNWVTGFRNPSFNSIKKLAEALNVSVSYFTEDTAAKKNTEKSDDINLKIIMNLIEKQNKIFEEKEKKLEEKIKRYKAENDLLKKDIEFVKKKNKNFEKELKFLRG